MLITYINLTPAVFRSAAPSTDNDASTAENDASVDDEKVDIGEEEDVDDEPVQESFDDKRDGVSASPISTEKGMHFLGRIVSACVCLSVIPPVSQRNASTSLQRLKSRSEPALRRHPRLYLT